MTLDVDPPDPPELNTALDVTDYDDVETSASEYRREELEEFLHKDGAWEHAFEEWTAHTDIDEEEFGIVEDLGLVEEFDFFWDEFVQRVGYHAPGIPEDWRERDIHPDLDSWNTVSGINAAMAELGDVVSRVLGDEYVDWDTEADLPDDLPDFE